MNWPPISGDATVGTKTLQPQYNKRIVEENLSDLHEPAWWSGVRVTVATPNRVLENVHVHVRLMKPDRTPAIDLGSCDWVQVTNTWTRFPWAIPAAMAKALDLRLEVTLIEDEDVTAVNEPLYVTMKTCFHEMPHLPPCDNYLFVNDDGYILQFWNGLQHVDGVPPSRHNDGRGYDPLWYTNHRVVAPLWMWDETLVFRVHDWNEQVPLNH
jgi:hypothetical protein